MTLDDLPINIDNSQLASVSLGVVFLDGMIAFIVLLALVGICS